MSPPVVERSWGAAKFIFVEFAQTIQRNLNDEQIEISLFQRLRDLPAVLSPNGRAGYIDLPHLITAQELAADLPEFRAER